MANDIVYNLVANSQTFVAGVGHAANAAKGFLDSLAKAEKQEAENRVRTLEWQRNYTRKVRDQELSDELRHFARMEEIRETARQQQAARDERMRSVHVADRQKQLAVEQAAIDARERMMAVAEEKEARLRESVLERKRAAYIRDREQQLAMEQAAIERRESLLASAETKEAANRQHNLDRQRSMNSANLSRQLAEEQRIIERNQNTASMVRRSLMTPRDFVVQDILAAKSAWKAGELDAKHYFDFVASQKQRLLAMNTEHALGYTGYGGRGSRVVQQLAFGLEDFATQYGTMGMMGGIRAASNNVSAAGMMFNPTVGIAASLASTITMVGIAAWESSKKLKDHKDDLVKLEEEYRGLNSIIKNTNDYLDRQREFGDIATMGVDQSKMKSESLSLSTEKLRAEITTREENAARIVTESLQKKIADKRLELQGVNDRITTTRGVSVPNDMADLQRRVIRLDIADLGKQQSQVAEKLARMPVSVVTDNKKAEEFRKQQLELEKLNLELETQNRLLKEYEKRQREAFDEEELTKQFDAEVKRQQDRKKMLDDQKKQVEEFRKQFRTPEEKYKDEMDRIAGLRRNGLDEVTASRAEKKALEDMRRETQKGGRQDAPIGAIDARGANARSGFEAALRSYMQTVPKAQTSPPPTQAEKEQIDLLKNSYKQLQELGRVLQKNLTSENLGLVMEVLNF